MNTIYMPNAMQPLQQCIDMGIDNFFTAKVNGDHIDSYQLVIKKLDNTIPYDSGKVILPQILKNKQLLSMKVVANTVTYRGQLKWILTYFNGTEAVSSGELIFLNMTTPILSTNVPFVVTGMKYTLEGIYSQAESIPVKSFNVGLYDSTGLIQSSGDEISSLIEYEIDGLANNKNYYLVLTIETQSPSGGGMTVSLTQYISVKYTPLTIAFKPTLTEIKDKSAMQIDWSALSEHAGVITGGSSFMDGFFVNGNVGLALDVGSYIEYDDFVLPPAFTLSFMELLPRSFNGIIFSTKDGGYMLGYSNVSLAPDIELIYTGTWGSEPYVGLRSGTARFSANANDNLQYSFFGTGINGYLVQSSHMGMAEIFIDGVSYGIVDLYKDDSFNQCMYPTVTNANGLITKEFYVYKKMSDISASTGSSLASYRWNDIASKHLEVTIANLPFSTHTLKINVLGIKNTLSDSNKVEIEYFEPLNSDVNNGGVDNKFYTIIQGQTVYSETIKINKNPFIFDLFPDHVSIRQYNIYNNLSDIANYTFDDLNDLTWGYMAQLNT